MGKLFGLILLLAALWVGITLYTEGTENAFGGIFAPIESQNRAEAPMATGLTPAAQSATPPAERRRNAPITDRVRQAVTEDIEYGASRRGR
jgi:hypothetical protein